MADSVQALRQELKRFQNLLTHGPLLSYSGEEKQSLLSDSLKLLERIDSTAECILTVGLLGGTGVGKSTLMNALAGSPVSSTSHRRPHTDRVLAYMHRDSDLPDPMRGQGMGRAPLPSGHGFDEARDQEDSLFLTIFHDADSIRHILLCDLPDFDSLVGEHRLRVLRFLEHLDVIVWVVSPEKYGDARFYDFLRQVPKARQNFTFVLNKADLLFEGRSIEGGYGELGKLVARFTEHLVDSQVPHPVIYALSSAQAMDSGPQAPWNQFAHFKQQIFQSRDAKEVLSIKAANLDVEVRQFLSVVDREVLQMESMRSALLELTGELEAGRKEWNEVGAEVLSAWLEGQFRALAHELLLDPSALMGPGHWVAQVSRAFRSRPNTPQQAEPFDLAHFQAGSLSLLRSQLDGLENRVAHRLLLRGHPCKDVAGLGGVFKAQPSWDRFVGNARKLMEIRIGEQRSLAASSFFRLIQSAVYAMVFCFFLVALGGDSNWREVMKSPGPGALTGLIAGMVLALFTPGGLAALASWMVIQMVVGLRFYGRYKKSLQRRVQKFIESLKLGLGKLWEEELHHALQHLTDRCDELEKRAVELSSLTRTSRKD